MAQKTASPNFGFTILMRKANAQTEGEFPLFVRLRLFGTCCEMAAKLHVREDEWQSDRKRVKGNSPRARKINDTIANLELHVRSTYNQMLAEGKIVTLDALKDTVLGIDTRKFSIIAEFTDYLALQRARIGIDYTLSSWK